MTALDHAIDAAARGDGPDTILLMHILGEAGAEEDARSGLSQAIASHVASDDALGVARLRRIRDLWAAHPGAWSVVRSTMAGITHNRQGLEPDAVLRYWADTFDRLAQASPEASVALYSLGSPALLAAATDEIVRFINTLGLLAPTIDALDVGCGIGRLLVALAPRLRSIRGIDIAARMVEAARRRCEHLPNVRIEQSSGRDLAFAEHDSVDLVIAADVFPYLVEAGGDLARTQIAECARILRPGGSALILNYSYRADIEADRCDIAAFSAAADLLIARNGSFDLSLWNGTTFLLRKPT